jgi:hypothetical protein
MSTCFWKLQWKSHYRGFIAKMIVSCEVTQSWPSLTLPMPSNFPTFFLYFFLRLRVQTASGAHRPSSPVSAGDSSPTEQKRPGREADHSPPSNTEVKTVWSCTSPLQYACMAWHLVKHRDSCTFLLFNIAGVTYGWTLSILVGKV